MDEEHRLRNLRIFASELLAFDRGNVDEYVNNTRFVNKDLYRMLSAAVADSRKNQFS